MRKDSDQGQPIEVKLGGPTGDSRRNLIKAPLAIAAASIAWPLLSGALLSSARAEDRDEGAKIDPRYYPTRNFRPDINLNGKLAVITGASRGNGRAIGEALAALGAEVIGTSRNPTNVPNPPAFPLLKLDIADPASVLAFPALLAAHPKF